MTTPITSLPPPRQGRWLTPRWAGPVLGLTALIWGATPFVIQAGLSDMSVPLLTALRLTLGLLCLAWVRVPTAAWRDGAPLGLLLLGMYWANTQGLLDTSASRATFTLSLAALLLPLFAGRAAVRNVLLLVLGVAGVGVMLLYPRVQVTAGDAWELLAAVLFAAYLLGLSRSVPRHGGLVSARVQLSVMTPLAWLWAAPHLDGALHLPAQAWWGVLYLGGAALGLALPLQSAAMPQLSPARAGQWLLLEPVSTVLFAALLSRALPGGHELIGAGLVLLALWLGTVGSRGPRRKSTPTGSAHVGPASGSALSNAPSHTPAPAGQRSSP